MALFPERLGRYLTTREEWVFLGLIAAFSLQRVTSASWLAFLLIAARFCLELAPILIFKLLQPHLQSRWPRARLRLLQATLFLIYPAALVLIDLTPPRSAYFLSSEGDILLALVLVEGLLLLNHGFFQAKRLKTGVYRFGFDRAVVLVLLFSALYGAALLVSNLPAREAGLASGANLDFGRLWRHTPLVLDWALQLFGLLMGGFLVYWLHRHVLVAQVLARAGLVVYALAAATTVVLVYPLWAQLAMLLPVWHIGEVAAPELGPFSWRYGMVAAALMLVTLPVVLTLQWQAKVNQVNALEQERMAAELALLKQQINPHFLFNTLNNLYALSLKKADQAPEVVLQLADLMRYVVYKGREQQVDLADEVAYLNDFIALYRLRLPHALRLESDMRVPDEAPTIAPLLLIVLLENAFKHGIEPAAGAADLQLRLAVTPTQIRFTCVNSPAPDAAASVAPGGVGLTNLKRRLALLYPGRHELNLAERDHQFSAELVLWSGEDDPGRGDER